MNVVFYLSFSPPRLDYIPRKHPWSSRARFWRHYRQL